MHKEQAEKHRRKVAQSVLKLYPLNRVKKKILRCPAKGSHVKQYSDERHVTCIIIQQEEVAAIAASDGLHCFCQRVGLVNDGLQLAVCRRLSSLLHSGAIWFANDHVVLGAKPYAA